MDTTMGTTMDTTVVAVDSTADTATSNSRGARTSTALPTVLARGLTRQEGGGATLQGPAVLMGDSHRGSPTTLGHTRPAQGRARWWLNGRFVCGHYVLPQSIFILENLLN